MATKKKSKQKPRPKASVRRSGFAKQGKKTVFRKAGVVKARTKRPYRSHSHPAVNAVSCPFCYEPAGRPCKSVTGSGISRNCKTHESRVTAFEEMEKQQSTPPPQEAPQAAPAAEPSKESNTMDVIHDPSAVID